LVAEGDVEVEITVLIQLYKGVGDEGRKVMREEKSTCGE